MRSLAFKLILGFLLISLVGVGLVAAFTRWATVNEFERLMLDQAEDDFLSSVTAYYESRGSWAGVERQFWAQAPSTGLPGTAPRPRQPPFVLVNPEGVVVLADRPDGLGRRMPKDNWRGARRWSSMVRQSALSCPRATRWNVMRWPSGT